MKTIHRVIALIAAAIIIFAALWLKCKRDPAINFLPGDRRAEWIVFPSPIEARAHPIAMLDATFRRQFELDSPRATARLEFRGAKRIELKLNGKNVSVPKISNWKHSPAVDVAGFLQTGTNTIEARVFNDDAPPALWLLLSAGQFRLHSDNNWEASLAGSAWRQAVSASQARYPRPGNLLAGGERTSEIWPRIWKTWAAFGFVVFLLVLIAIWWRGKIAPKIAGPNAGEISVRQAVMLLIAGAILWGVLFENNAATLPFHCGYDASSHIAYIKYLQERRVLPLPNEGYEMFQPPLYYALSATALSLSGLTVADTGSVAVLRALTMGCGIAHFVFVFLCLRLLFPRRVGAQLLGMLVAAFLPMQLYLSHYVTNETLAAMLVSATVYLGLRLLKQQGSSGWGYAGLGLCAGAAILTKATGLLLMPPLIGALLLKIMHERIGLGTAVRTIGATLAAIFITCGWYYIWIWRHFGTPIVGNWERAFGFNWWQDPGFHTAVDYFRFGRALTDPLFSGFSGFADGIYSTLWGDGLGGGLSDMLSRTPWNYDLVTGGYLLALGPTLLIIVGLGTVLYRFARQPSPEWFLLIGLSAAVIVALAFMTLRVASHAQVKAFYGLSALVPLCSCATAGWEKVRGAPRLLRLCLTALFLFWGLNSFASIWIRNSASQRIYAGRRFISEHRLDAAAAEASQAATADPSNAMAQCFLAAVLDDTGRTAEALEHTARGTQLDPGNGQCQIQVAVNHARRGEIEPAMTDAQHLIESEPENTRAYDVLFTCARQLRRTSEAIAIGRDALAISAFDPDLHYRIGLAAGEAGDFVTAVPQFGYASLLQPGRPEVENKLHLAIAFAAKSANASEQLTTIASSAPDSTILLNEIAWIFATNAEATLRNGSEAVRLSERACFLTNRKRPDFLATLAAAYAETGKFSDAIVIASDALSLANSKGDTKTIVLVQNLLRSFQTQQPYREEQ